MSSKIALLISMLYFALLFLLGIDLALIQAQYSDLDSKSIAVTYEISSHGDASKSFIKELEEKYNVSIINISNSSPEFGDVVTYTLEKYYQPLILSSSSLAIRIKRVAVVGYY